MPKIQPTNEQVEIHLSLIGLEIDITPENASFTQYIMGKVALDDVLRDTESFDHIYIENADVDESESGIYIFRPDEKESPRAAAVFVRFSQDLLVHGFPIHANVTEIDPGTMYAFQKKINRDAANASKGLIDELTAFLGENGTEDK